MIKCRICGKEKNETEFFLASNKKNIDKCCKTCKHTLQQERRRLFKIKLVEMKGGKCEICGYNTCISALQFHHINPSTKEFIIDRDLKDLELIHSEMEKCMLVCANCHREIHCMNCWDNKNSSHI